MRITEKRINDRFNTLCLLLNKSTNQHGTDENGKYKSNIGAWGLDYNSTYGGYVITEITTDGGGQTNPFGARRNKPSVFFEMLGFAINTAIIITKEKEDEKH